MSDEQPAEDRVCPIFTHALSVRAGAGQHGFCTFAKERAESRCLGERCMAYRALTRECLLMRADQSRPFSL